MKLKLSCVLLLVISSFCFSQSINQLDAKGFRHGVWEKKFNNTNQIRYKGTFNHGKEVGLFEFYKLVRKKNVLSATKYFDTLTGIANVKFISHHGKVISEGKMRGKTYVGNWRYYHKNSLKLMTTEQYNENGLLNGKRLVYYKTGVLAEETNYVNGVIQGESKWYSIDDVLIKSFMYHDGELHGVSKYYSPKGELEIEGRYKNGKKTGIWTYYEDGKFLKKVDYRYKRKSKQ